MDGRIKDEWLVWQQLGLEEQVTTLKWEIWIIYPLSSLIHPTKGNPVEMTPTCWYAYDKYYSTQTLDSNFIANFFKGVIASWEIYISL